MNKIGLAIRHYREMNKMTQKDLGKRINIDPNAISHYETGKRQPSLDILINIAEALGVQAEKLLKPHGGIWRKNCTESIIHEMDFLKKNDHFIRMKESESGKSIQYLFKTDDDPSSNYWIMISKKLRFFDAYCWLKRPNLHPIILSPYNCPEWFQELIINAQSTFFDMAFTEGVKIDIPLLIHHAVLKEKIGFTWAEKEKNEILNRYIDFGIIYSKYDGIVEDIVLNVKRYHMQEEICKVQILKSTK